MINMRNFLSKIRLTKTCISIKNFTTISKENFSKNNKSENSFQDIKLGKFYEFMETNINNMEIKNKNQITNSNPTLNTQIDDLKFLLEVLKCPITESNLEECEEGLKVSHIIYPKRQGIYILVEEEAQFKF